MLLLLVMLSTIAVLTSYLQLYFQYLTKKLGVDPVMFGYLQTTFAITQLAGGPLFGQFGDKMGGQAAMILAFFSASLSYFLLGIAGTFFMLFISRLPSVFMHAMQGNFYFKSLNIFFLVKYTFFLFLNNKSACGIKFFPALSICTSFLYLVSIQ